MMTTNEINKMYGNTPAEGIYAAYKQVDIADTNNYDNDRTPLHTACLHADSAAVEILLARGANPNVADRYGEMPLHLLAKAVKNDKHFPEGEIRTCAEQLFDAGARVIYKDEEHLTPILVAAKRGCHELLEVAVAKGAKLSATDTSGNTALHLVCDFGVRNALESLEYQQKKVDRLDVAKLQQAKAKMEDSPEEYIWKTLYESELKMHEEAYKELVACQRTVDGFFYSAKALMAGGLDPEEKNTAGKTALELAVESGAKRIGALLRGIDESSAEFVTGGMTLHQAVVKGDCAAVKACLAGGADLNAVSDETGDFKGMTPLMAACRCFDLDMVSLLLEAGADPNFKDAEGRTAPARWYDWLGTHLLLTQHTNESIPQKIFRELVSHGYEFDSAADDKSNTLLTLACNVPGVFQGSIISELLAAGADVNRPNAAGQTPLMLISRAQGSHEVTDLQIALLEAGADVAAADRDGMTPLHYAAMNKYAAIGKDMAEMLFEFGDPKPDAVNNAGKSALEIATENNNEPLVKLILMNS